jgi:putative transposase
VNGLSELQTPRCATRFVSFRCSRALIRAAERRGDLSGANLERVLAEVEVTFSNSMIEAFWRSLENSWLYLHGLESESGLRRLIAIYVQAHNEVMPHPAFNGQTPDEVYFGTGDAIAAELASGRERARDVRMARNRGAQCGACIARAG